MKRITFKELMNTIYSLWFFSLIKINDNVWHFKTDSLQCFLDADQLNELSPLVHKMYCKKEDNYERVL